MGAVSQSLEAELELSCRRARRRFVLASAGAGFVLGSAFAIVTSLGLWRIGATPQVRSLAVLGIAVGAAAGALRGRWLTPGRQALVLDFDRRLGSSQVLSAALTCIEAGLEGPLTPVVRAQALQLLAGAGDRHLPPVLRRRYALGLFGSILFIFSLTLPAQQEPVPLALPSPRLLRWQHLGDLSPLSNLADAPNLTDGERRRTAELMAHVQSFQQHMVAGLPPEQVGHELNKLQDGLRSELDALRAPSEQAGLTAAVAALREEPHTARAAALLEQGDLTRFDQEVRRLSSAEERASRFKAQSAINRAAVKARDLGAVLASRVMSEQSEMFEARAATSERIRELITQLGSQSPDAAPSTASAPLETEAGPRRGNAEASRVEPSGQTPRLTAPSMARGALGDVQDFTPSALAELERLSRVSSNDAAQELTDALQRFGSPAPSAQRHQVMWETTRAVSRLQDALHGNATQLQQAEAGTSGGGTGAAPGPRGAAAPNSPGRRAEHEAETAALAAEGLRARTQPPNAAGVFRASVGESFSESPLGTNGRVGRVSAALGPSELQGVERPSIPSEYREQVSRYFSAE
jgi:hypothetical protein